ncbi:MAG: hypothetical protein RDV48_03925 [Candidatus Eremiobacteraeota bacterium]|nr:hypothetical protein [Candidatus Eremiobacteraeota bacterium]
MKYSFLDVVISALALSAGLLALIELLLFFLCWILVISQSFLHFIPYLGWLYLSLQPVNNWGLIGISLITLCSFLRYRESLKSRSLNDGSDGVEKTVRLRKKILVLSLIATALAISHRVAWSAWPWVYW